jgi:hypothetical protein
VSLNTPLAVAPTGTGGDPWIFYVNRENPPQVVRYRETGGSFDLVCSYVPGSRLGATTTSNGQSYLFHIPLESPESICVRTLDADGKTKLSQLFN